MAYIRFDVSDRIVFLISLVSYRHRPTFIFESTLDIFRKVPENLHAMEYYFSRIQLFDESQIVTPSLKRTLDRKRRKKLEKLERQGILIGKNPAKLLHKAQKLAQSDEKETDSVAEEIRRKWKIAILKAQGCKVKDDLNLLRKSANKIKKIKRKHFEKWQERNQLVEQTKQERQAKRQANIQERRNRKLTKKFQKAKSKGRIFSVGQT
ncbi:hypothetical protein P879_11428 [Paragonimus westermani]|uniref:Ribosomal RNA-processing protein 14/surfeit locus protein 6 C-terminal domain-containing protein n=1 Tax=Paragonimus westermani TaxID=34504 RepID=A0A8T0D8L5_9TREM|nr:hypothetical protein P879_11428 [Paragonimus westermani]